MKKIISYWEGNQQGQWHVIRKMEKIRLRVVVTVYLVNITTIIQTQGLFCHTMATLNINQLLLLSWYWKQEYRNSCCFPLSSFLYSLSWQLWRGYLCKLNLFIGITHPSLATSLLSPPLSINSVRGCTCLSFEICPWDHLWTWAAESKEPEKGLRLLGQHCFGYRCLVHTLSTRLGFWLPSAISPAWVVYWLSSNFLLLWSLENISSNSSFLEP